MIALNRSHQQPVLNLDSLPNLHESNWDVVVIGAGPAGSSAAIEIANANRSVLLLEARKFPRPKVCGGCLNQPAGQILASLLGAKHPVWNSASKLNRFEIHDQHRSLNLSLPTGFSIDRSTLDQALVNHAVQCGAVFIDNVSGTLAPLRSTEESVRRRVHVASRKQMISVNANCVVVAVGLGNAFKKSFPNPEPFAEDFQPVIARGSRVGLAIEARSPTAEQLPNTIVMSVADAGYVGITYGGQDRVHVAAAVDVAKLRKLGPQSLVEKILAESGCAAIDFHDGRWSGTPELTRRAASLSGHRVVMIGDAAKYVEPFTGEGIHWALKSGVGVARLIVSEETSWSSELARRWEQWHQQNIQPSQRICRRIAIGLRSRLARMIALNALSWQPQLANFVIEKINKL